jgi:hypothetical protein
MRIIKIFVPSWSKLKSSDPTKPSKDKHLSTTTKSVNELPDMYSDDGL